MKAAQAEQELQTAEKAIKLFGGKVKEHFSFSLPVEESERNIYVITKTKETPQQISTQTRNAQQITNRIN